MQYQEPRQEPYYFASLLEQDIMPMMMDYTSPSLSYSHMLSSAYDLTAANIEYPWYFNNEHLDTSVISAAPFPDQAIIAPQLQDPIFSYPSPDMHYLSPSTMAPYSEEFPLYMSPASTIQDLSPAPVMNLGFDDHNESIGIATPPPSPMSSSNRSEIAPSYRQRPVYKCDICNKTFTRPYNLRSHQRTHNNDRPYPCDHPGCKWSFARPHDLKRHQLLHSGIKPHKCEHCTLRFSRRDALRRHWNVEKKCGDAEKRFPTSKPYRRRRVNNKTR